MISGLPDIFTTKKKTALLHSKQLLEPKHKFYCVEKLSVFVFKARNALLIKVPKNTYWFIC